MARTVTVGLLMAAAAVEGFSPTPTPGLRSSTARAATGGAASLEMKNGAKRAAIKRFFKEKILRRKPEAAGVDLQEASGKAPANNAPVAATPAAAKANNPNTKAFRMPPIAEEIKAAMAIKVEAPPSKLPINKAKEGAAAANQAQWGIGGAPASTVAPPSKLPLNKAKEGAIAANQAQWGIGGAPASSPPAPASTPASAPASEEDVPVSEFARKFDEIKKNRTQTLTQKLMD